jgi:hypothetical protein
MPSTTFGILTTTGKSKEAAALANNTALTITHIAFGDADYAPTGGETALQNEIGRKPVHATGIVDGAPNTAFFDCLLEVNDGPFIIREAGLFDGEGDMVGIIKYDPPVNKPIPSSGQSVEALLRSLIIFSDLENLILNVQTMNAFVAAERTINTEEGVGGGGDLSQDRTFKLDFSNLAPVNVAQFDGAADKLALFDASEGKHVAISTNQLRSKMFPDGDGLLQRDDQGVWSWAAGSFVAQTVTLNAGTGLTGLGNLSQDRTVNLDLNSISVGTPTTTDKLTFVNGSGHFTAALSEIIRMAKPSGARNFFFSQMAS